MRFFIPAIAAFCLLWIGCVGDTLESQWRDRPITVDGVDSEWNDVAAQGDRQQFGISLFNDNEFLYLRLFTWDRGLIRQVFRGGLKIWMDPNGRREKKSGIEYPLGMGAGNPPSAPREERGQGAVPEQMSGMLEARQNEMNILGASKFKNRLIILSDTAALRARVVLSRGRLVYEFRIPLFKTADSLFFISAKPSETMALGLETQSMEAGPMERHPQGPDGQASGQPGGRHGRGHGPGEMEQGFGRPGPQTAEPLELWFAVKLAVEKSK